MSMSLEEEFWESCVKENKLQMSFWEYCMETEQDSLVLGIADAILDRWLLPFDNLCVRISEFLQENGITSWDGSILGYVPPSEKRDAWHVAVGLDIVPSPF